jgi:hypothetical protein
MHHVSIPRARGVLVALIVAVLSLVAVSSPTPAWATGETWSSHSAAATNGWASVAYGNGVWVAVAQSGTNRVMRSLDPSPDSGGGGSSAEPALAATGLSIAATVALVANAGALIAGGTLLVSRSRKMRAGR